MYKEFDFVRIDNIILGQIVKRLKSNSDSIYFVKYLDKRKIELVNEDRLQYFYKD